MVREQVTKARRWVVKVGSSLLTNDGAGLDFELMAQWVEQVHRLRKRDIEVVLVSSGAVSEGMKRLGWHERPHALHDQQAAAAVGQMGLVQAYESCFQKHGLHTAQILLTHNDLSDRQRYLNARSTLRTLLGLGVIPIVNENDTVAVEEIRFGDNDTLAGLVTNLIEAELLVMLTDQDGMYDSDPRGNPEAKFIHEAQAGDPQLETMAAGSGSGRLGRGGMLTKVRAAERAARSGARSIIASGREPDVLVQIADGKRLGTMVVPSHEPLVARKQWLASQLNLSGKLVLDDGAVQVLRTEGSSLLAVGVAAVEGGFHRGEVVVCVDQGGVEIARGLVNYSAAEARKIQGQSSEQIERLLGYVDEAELIHRDNLVLIDK